MIVSKELGLDTLPQVDLEVMSVSIIDEGIEPLIYYTDLGEAAVHMEQVHGIEVMIGMAEMMGWSAAPTRALGRFEAGTLPKSLDEMYACATNDAERASITEMLFGSATDVLDRYLPDKQKHAALRGMLAFLAVNSTYRGPSSPGSAAGLAFGMAVPDENTVLTKKLQGGIGVLTQHLATQYAEAGGELRLEASVAEIVVAEGRVTGIVLDGGERIEARLGRLRRRPGPDPQHAGHRRRRGRPASAPACPESTTAAATSRCTSPSTGCRSSRRRTSSSTTRRCRARSAFSPRPRSCSASSRTAAAASSRQTPAVAFQIPSASDPDLAPPGKAAASAFALWFPVEEDPAEYARLKAEMGQRVIDRITPVRTELREPHPQAHDVHAQAHGHDVRGARRRLLPRPDPPRAARPVPTRSARVHRPAARHRGSLPRQRRLLRRSRHHLHPRLQRGAGGAGGPLTGLTYAGHMGSVINTNALGVPKAG